MNDKLLKIKRELFLNDLRDSLNTVPGDLTEIYALRQEENGEFTVIAREENGWYLISRLNTYFHRKKEGPQGEEARYNRKFIHPDETGSSSEAVICFAPGKDPYLVTDPINGGTYNFISPLRYKFPKVTVRSLLGHFNKDVLPYLKAKRQLKSGNKQ